MGLTQEAVLALSPDAASTKAAQGLLAPTKWPELGASDTVVWGACQGSGSKPYQTQVDTSGAGPVFRCSCPSRKFPCKHGLALLLLQVRSPQLFTAPEPAWVTEWLASRQEKAEKKAAKAVAASTAVTPTAIDSAANAKRWKQRVGFMQKGAEELALWLDDRMRAGLASVSENDRAQWTAMAARMVDAKANGLGQRLTAAFAVVGQGASWHARLLERLGHLQLLLDATLQLQPLQEPPRFPAGLQADIRQAVGWPLERDDVLRDGERVEDDWHVMAVVVTEREQRLMERRVWLYGHRSQRRALLLDYAYGGTGFEQAWVASADSLAVTWRAELAFYPSADPLRALLVGSVLPASSTSPLVPHLPASEEWNALFARMAVNPWGNQWPLWLDGARLQYDESAWSLVLPMPEPTRQIPLALSDDDAWRWMALAGGQAVRIWGEWTGDFFRPLSAWMPDGSYWAARGTPLSATTPALAPAQGSSGYWNTLLQAALVGTERPWKLEPPANSGQFGHSEQLDAVAPLLYTVYSQNPSASGGLLRLAGAASWCQRTGWMIPLASPSASTITAAPEESRAIASAGWMALLGDVLKNAPQRLQQQVLFAMNQHGLRIPTADLVVFLEYARQNAALRSSMQPLWGERGRWLAAYNPPWRFACGAEETADLETQWTHGSLEQRCAVLQAERAVNPDAGRARLQTDWKNLPAKDRATLIAVLLEGLSEADEAFLTDQLKDRAQDVRSKAADLLSALPTSAYSQRMIARLLPLVSRTTTEAETVGTVKIDIQPPEQTDAQWKADQLEVERPKYEYMGERAWWLLQLTRRTPLSWWTQHTGFNPEQLIEHVRHSHWDESLFRGWRDAFKNQPLPEWRLALLRTRSDFVDACLEGCPAHTHLDVALSEQLVQTLRTGLRTQTRYPWNDAVCILHPHVLPSLVHEPLTHPETIEGVASGSSYALYAQQQAQHITQQIAYVVKTRLRIMDAASL